MKFIKSFRNWDEVHLKLSKFLPLTRRLSITISMVSWDCRFLGLHESQSRILQFTASTSKGSEVLQKLSEILQKQVRHFKSTVKYFKTSVRYFKRSVRHKGPRIVPPTPHKSTGTHSQPESPNLVSKGTGPGINWIMWGATE